VVTNPNKLINGDMRINQRGATSGNMAASYTNTIDRWLNSATAASKISWTQVQSSASDYISTGQTHYMKFVSLSAFTPGATDYFQFGQAIESDQISEVMWGTGFAGARPVTLSFWVNSSQLGNYSASIQNYIQSRSYTFTYNIPAASTWTKIAVTIPGDIAAAWTMSGNSGCMYVFFDLGSGSTYRTSNPNNWLGVGFYGVTGSTNLVATNGAQLFLTGVKLEVGSAATPYPQQSLAKSLADCQRYFCKSYDQNAPPGTTAGAGLAGAIVMSNGPTADAASVLTTCWKYPVAMRADPSIFLYSANTGVTGKGWAVNAAADVNIVVYAGGDNFISYGVNAASIAAHERIYSHLTANAEL
jgi:hypothetical protein